MRSLVLEADKSLHIKDHDLPTLAEGEVLVQVKAASLNHRELWIVKGLYPGMQLPCILGADGAGVIVECDEAVDKSMKDSRVVIYPAYDWGPNPSRPLKKFRVLGMPDPGTLAEYIAVPASHCLAIPEHLSYEEAAALPVAGLTAWRGLMVHGQLKQDDHLLITGIGGGVAQMALMIGKAVGAKMYVTSSSPAKVQDAVAQGATGGVNYKDEDWNLALKELAEGIDIVLDSSPDADLDRYFKFLNMGGRIVAYGSTGNRMTRLNISKFFLRHIQFIGSAMGSPQDFKNFLDFIAQHQLKPRIHAVYPFEQTVEAMAALAEGNQIGKIVVRMGE